MSFSADWLSLRAPADAAARDVGLLAAFGAFVGRRLQPLIADIGCGRGGFTSELRNWAPSDARWRLVDNDRGLLTLAAEAHPSALVRELDLAREVEHAVERADAVVASAFFDLASEEWIDRFVKAVPDEACVYAALTYDGEEEWSPEHKDDAAVLDALRRHMRRDKGLGEALGADAGAVLAEKLRADGRRVLTAPSPWRLTAEHDGALMNELADGIASAVTVLGVNAADWRAAPRRAARIGHIDIFAGPRVYDEPPTEDE